jgi:hypothetical protein
MSESDFMQITPEHLAFAQMLGRTVKVERKPSETEALFLNDGNFKIVTANGNSFAEGPVWILWDTAGFPYPITPTEFERLYERKGPTP